MKTAKLTYQAYQSLKAGTNSTYSIRRSDGKTTALGFDSMQEAQSYIDDRLMKGQDPLTMSIDETAMTNYLLTN